MYDELLALANGVGDGGELSLAKYHFQALSLIAEKAGTKLKSTDYKDLGGGSVMISAKVFRSLVLNADRNFDLDAAFAATYPQNVAA